MGNGYRVSVWGNEKFLGMDDGDGCTIMWMHLMLPHGILKNATVVNFILYICYHSGKNQSVVVWIVLAASLLYMYDMESASIQCLCDLSYSELN